MRITFVIEAFKRGGKERRCLQLIQGLNKKGFNDIQMIIVNNGIEYSELYDTSAQIVIIDKKARGLSLISTYRSIKNHIDSFRPDIIHTWGEASMLYISMLRLTKRFAYICANIADCNKPNRFSKRNIVSRISFLLADAVVGNSLEGLKAYSAPKRKAHCIYNGFNEIRFKLVEKLDPSALREELNVKTRYLVSMFARVDYYKDYDAFISLAREVLSKRDDVTFLAVGGGLYYDAYKDKPSAEENLRFVGFRSDVERIMAITDISVLFSNYKFHKEGISNSILESMALGTPVIATNDGGSPEIISDGVNGFLVNENDISVASDALCKLLDNSQELLRVSENARMTVQDKFLLEHMIYNYQNLYAKLLGKLSNEHIDKN